MEETSPKTEQELRKEEYREDMKMCADAYRAPLKWAGIETQEQWEKRKQRIAQKYEDGNHFLEMMGMSRNFDPDTLAVLIHLRQSAIKQYGITTAPEMMILDATLLCYYHLIKLNAQIGNMEAVVDKEFFVYEEPRKYPVMEGGAINYDKQKYEVEGVVSYAINRYIPLLERFNKMLLRNLKALRDFKRMNINLNIGQVGQMNVGETDVHITAEKGREKREIPS